LTPEESEFLFEALRRVVVEEGRAVALVSHKLDEILQATDEITIMRRGRVVDRVETRAATAQSLARAMVGRPVSLRNEAAALGLVDVVTEKISAEDEPDVGAAVTDQPPVLRIHDVVVRDRRGRRLLDGCSIEVRPGEIVGVAGVEGNGQRALADLLSSLEHLESGTVTVDGVEVRAGRAGSMAAAGVAVIPEDRHDSGIVLDMTVEENLFLVAVEQTQSWGVIDRSAMRRGARALIEQYDIQCTGPDAPLWSLSGGNQQRVVVARELAHSPKVLVAAQPTRGLDVGAIEFMTERLRAVAASGVGVLLISNELEEILELSDRIVALYRGKVIGEMARADLDRDRLGLLLGGTAA
jgi:simple sugar transport system ATP-binding protein